MKQIRIHGRGGQGVVTAAEMLSIAAFAQGKHAQAFPSFGSERMGAPVIAYCRIDDRPIQLREPIAAPDALVIQDSTLLSQLDVFAGLAEGGIVLINTTRPPEELEIAARASLKSPTIRSVAASQIAIQHIGRPLPNAVLLAALAAVSGWIDLESLCTAIKQKFNETIAQKNIAAARAAYETLAGAMVGAK